MSEATGQPATQTTGGGSILTEGIGTPQGTALDPTQQTTTQRSDGTTQAPAGRPEWFPDKFWRDDRPDHEGLAKSYTSLEKLLGSDKIPAVTNWDDPEQTGRWYKASGRPDDAKGYEFEKGSDLPDGFYDDMAEQSFRDWAYNNGLNKRQAGNLHKAYVQTQLDRHKAYQDQQRTARERLKSDLVREHGAAYEGFAKGARAAMEKFADPDFVKFLDESGHGDDPRMIRAFGRIGKAMMGDTALRGQPRVEVNTADLEKQIGDYRTKYAGELGDRNHPDHKMRVGEFTKLHERLYPEPQQ